LQIVVLQKRVAELEGSDERHHQDARSQGKLDHDVSGAIARELRRSPEPRFH
jgi:hypothetical protein